MPVPAQSGQFIYFWKCRNLCSIFALACERAHIVCLLWVCGNEYLPGFKHTCDIPTVRRGERCQNDKSSVADLTIVAELSTYGLPTSALVSRAERLALQSWVASSTSVLALVDSSAVCGVITGDFPVVRCLPHRCGHPTLGTPSLSCLLLTGEAHSFTPFLLFTHEGLVFGDVLPTLALVSGLTQHFIMVGRSFRVPGHRLSESRLSEVHDMLTFARLEGARCDGLDYFLYPRNCSLAGIMPPFLLGEPVWENWLLREAINHRIKVVDTSADVVTLHLDSTQAHRTVKEPPTRGIVPFEFQSADMNGLRFADFKVQQGKMIPNGDFEIRQLKAAARSSPYRNFVVVVVVPCGFGRLISNWLGWARKWGLTGFVVFVMDREAEVLAVAEDVPVVRPRAALLSAIREDECGSVLRVEAMLVERNRFLVSLLNNGLGFVSLSVSTVLLGPFNIHSLGTKQVFGKRLSHVEPEKLSDGV